MHAGFPNDFISGAIAMGYLVVGLCFLKFWKRTHDGLFITLAVAFWLLALNTAFSGSIAFEKSWIYILRLAAFTLIIIAILRKNRRSLP
jgi:hypothetical protein